jgi:hypothetical protein
VCRIPRRNPRAIELARIAEDEEWVGGVPNTPTKSEPRKEVCIGGVLRATTSPSDRLPGNGVSNSGSLARVNVSAYTG